MWSRLNQLLTTDFCPSINRYVYWLKQPVGWFAVAAVAGLLIGLFLSWKGWFLFTIALAIVVSQLIWPRIQILCCDCHVEFSQSRVEEFEAVQLQLHLRNRGPFPLVGMAVKHGFLSILENTEGSISQPNGEDIEIALSRVPAFSTNVYCWTFVPRRRGVYPRETPVLSTAFPFGISDASKPVEVVGELVVWPRRYPLKGNLPVCQQFLSAAGEAGSKAGDAGDTQGTRLWRQGDSMRNVHWPQTVKQIEDLVVRERQATPRRTLSIYLDNTFGCRDKDQATFILDAQIRLLASLVEHLESQGTSLTVWIGNHPVPVGGRFAVGSRFLDHLAVAALDTSESSPPTGGADDLLVIAHPRTPCPEKALLQLVVDQNGVAKVKVERDRAFAAKASLEATIWAGAYDVKPEWSNAIPTP